MLFGGSLGPGCGNIPSATIGIGRTESQWSVLWWAKVLLELHGIRMHLAVGERTIESKLGYKSRTNLFLAPSYQRWYPDPPGAVTPDDIKLTPRMLAVWMVDAMSITGGTLPARLTAPRMSESVAASLCGQIRQLGWKCEPVTTARYHAIDLDKSNGSTLTQWLADMVPASVWNAE